MFQEAFIARLRACEGPEPLPGKRRKVQTNPGPCPFNDVAPAIRVVPTRKGCRHHLSNLELRNSKGMRGRSLAPASMPSTSRFDGGYLASRRRTLLKKVASYTVEEFIGSHCSKCAHVRLRRREAREAREAKASEAMLAAGGPDSTEGSASQSWVAEDSGGVGPIRTTPSGKKRRKMLGHAHPH